jgi:hypothetical protein
MARSHRESHHNHGITDQKSLQQTSATKSASKRRMQRSKLELIESPPSGAGGSRNGSLWNIENGSASLCLDVEGPDDVAPLLRFVGDELAEVVGRTDERCATQIGEPRHHLMIGESGVDLVIELLDDLGRRGLRCADAGPGAFETRAIGRMLQSE